MTEGGEVSAARTGAPSRLWPLLLVAILAQGLVNFDFFAMGLALPRMAHDLGSTTTDMQWVISAYMITLAALFIPGGRLGDIYGRKRFLLAGAALFGVASLAAGFAQHAGEVVAFRVLQGAGAAVIFPMSIACVTAAVPREKVTRYAGLVFGTAAIGTALGPFIGGALTELLSWRWVFFFNTIIAAVVVIMGRLYVRESRDETAVKRIDKVGVLLIASGVATVTVAADVAGRAGWISVQTFGLVGLGVGLLVAFVMVEKRVAHPLLDLGLFKIRVFDVLLVAGSIGNIANTSMILLITMLLQQVRGLSPLEAGSVFLASSLGTVFAGRASGRLARRPAWAVMCGSLVIAAVGLVLLSIVTAWPLFVASFFIAGFGVGMCWSFPSVAAQGVVPTEKSGAASGTVLTVLVGAGGIFVAVTATAIENRTAAGESLGAAIDLALVAMAGVALLGFLITLLLGRARRRSLVTG